MKERQAIIEEEMPPEVKRSAPGKTRKKLDQNNSQIVPDYTNKALVRNRNANNRSVSFLSTSSVDKKPLAIEVKLDQERKRLRELKKYKRSMLDSFIKKVVKDEEEQKEKEDLLLKKKLEDEEYMRNNEIRQNVFHDKMARKRAKEQLEKEKKKEEELK